MTKPILCLALRLCAAVSFSVMAQPVLLENITLIDVKNLQLKSGQTVTFDGDKITAIYATGSQKRPADSSVLDMQGKYLLPGLIDAHVHHATEPDDGDNAAVTQQRLGALLQGGVTTVRDMGGDVRVLTGLKRQAELDLIQSPDIYYSVIIGGSEFFSDPRTIASARGKIPGDTDWMRSVDAQTDVDALMQRTLGTGATGIKIYAKVPADIMPNLAASAKKHGLKVWAHAYVGPAKPEDAVQAGVEVISHAPGFSCDGDFSL